VGVVAESIKNWNDSQCNTVKPDMVPTMSTDWTPNLLFCEHTSTEDITINIRSSENTLCDNAILHSKAFKALTGVPGERGSTEQIL
jgi:hypothetical protein